MNNLQKLKNLTYTRISQAVIVPVYLNIAPLNSDGSFPELPIIIIRRQSVKPKDRLITADYTRVEAMWTISCIANTSEDCDELAQTVFDELDNTVIYDDDIGDIRNYVESIDDDIEIDSNVSQIDVNMRQVFSKI